MEHELWKRPTPGEEPYQPPAEAGPVPADASPATAAEDGIQQESAASSPPSAAALRPVAPPPRRARGVVSFAAVVVLSAAAGAAFITGLDSLRNDASATAVSSSASTAIMASLPARTTSAPDVADIYAAVSPSVVEITTTARNSGGLGSGVVLSTQGLILTNYHVIQGATSITVNFSDGQTATAKVLETRPNDDLATIKVDGVNNLKAAKMGDSSTLRPGDAIIAIGNPLGLDNTVTTGVVSALDRELQGGRGQATLEGLIQIDAAVNSGNSGGGLFNSNGELVGIPSAIENPSGQTVFVGVAYAIPIKTARSDLTSVQNL